MFINTRLWSIMNLTTISKFTLENKPSIITSNFNLNLIKYMQNTGVNQFFENILSNNFSPQTIVPLRITEKTATLIDNIFTNSYKHNSDCDQVISLLTFMTPSLSFKSLNILSNLHLNKILQSFAGTIRISTKRHYREWYKPWLWNLAFHRQNFRQKTQRAWDVSRRSQSDLHWDRHFRDHLETTEKRWLFRDVFKTCQIYLKKMSFL